MKLDSLKTWFLNPIVPCLRSITDTLHDPKTRQGRRKQFVTGPALAVRDFYKHGNCSYKVENMLEA